VAGDGGIALVIDRPGLEDGLGGAEDLLHPPQLAIGERDRQGGKRRVGAQHLEAVETGALGDAGRADLEVAGAQRSEEALVAGIADQLLVALLELSLQAVEDGDPGGDVARPRPP